MEDPFLNKKMDGILCAQNTQCLLYQNLGEHKPWELACEPIKYSLNIGSNDSSRI